MEVFRDLGVEGQVLADATPHELIGDTVFCTSIAGEEIGRIRTWGTHPAREADYQLASPSLICDIPQTYLEPILVKNATARGTQTRFSTEYLSHEQDAAGVDVRVRDRLTGAVYTIRAGSGPTRPCRTPTTCPGSSRRCSAGRPPPVCSTPIRPSAPRWPGRSCCGPTSQAASSASSSTRSV